MKPYSIRHGASLKTHYAIARYFGSLLIAIFVLAGCSSKPPMMVQAPNLYVDTGENPYGEVPSHFQSIDAPVIFATDRLWEEVKGVEGYGFKRSRIVSYGLCTVRMGDANSTWADLVAASTQSKRPKNILLTLTNIERKGAYPAARPIIQQDDKWSIDPVEIQERAANTEQIHALLRERLALTPRKEVFLFVHGYNNSFASSAFRMAQAWHYFGRQGVPVVFSWPAGSTGILQGYTRDRESGEFANAHVKSFLRDIASCPEVEKLHLIAHSRGTDILATAVRELHNEITAAGKNSHAELKVGQVVLAAPDIDLDVFIERFSSDRVGLVADQATIYVSPNDKAIGISSWLFGSIRRVGQTGLADLSPDFAAAFRRHPFINVIDMRAKTDKRGHGYFLSSPAALSDLILVVRDGRKPGAVNGRPLYDAPEAFWQLRDGYPTVPSTSPK